MLEAMKPKLTKINLVSRMADVLILETENGLIKIEPVSAGILRIVYTLRNEFSTIKGLGIEPQKNFGEWHFSDNENTVELKTLALKLLINKSDGKMTYFDANGNRLTGEPEKNGKELVPFDSDARKLYWKQTRDHLFSKGVDAWWCDSSEPFTPEWNNPIILGVYPGADSNFTLYQDERNGYGYETGEFATTTLTWSESEGKLTIHPRKGKYPGMPNHVTFIEKVVQ